ncbi:MAG TPA: ATP-binding protein, partial [Holophaga sp.]|nr:ATP-binding protein [Holophaga sp.]
FRDILSCLQQQGLLFGTGTAADPESLKALEEQYRALDLDYLLEEVPKAVEQTRDGVARVARIVGAMKDFSHPGMESKVHVDLNHAIESTLIISHNEWKYVAEVATDYDPGLPDVPCFPSEFNQVILNLVVNAAHAIQEAREKGNPDLQGRIRISTRQEGQEALVRIADNGAGIPESIREKIFEPFFTTKPIGKGTGQGLAIAHAVIVDKHKGRLSFDTETGKGTTFTIALPLGMEPAKP